MSARECPRNERLPANAVSATGTKLERRHAVEAQALASVRQLLVELAGTRGLEELGARGSQAHLERELGLGSLERVELMLRLGNTCGVRLPDRGVAEADTVQDLIDAILRENPSTEGSTAATTEPRISQPFTRDVIRSDIEEQIR